MSKRESDIGGVFFCTIALVLAVGSGFVCSQGLMSLVNNVPIKKPEVMFGSGLFCLFWLAAVTQYVSSRRNRRDPE